MLLVAAFSPVANAQNEGQYTHFMYNRLSYNPAYAGSSGAIAFTLLYNNQWMGLDLQAPAPGVDPGKTPVNYLFSFDMPVSFLHGGLGVTLNSEAIGYRSNTTVNVDYAFRIYWGPGSLSAGVEANLYNFSFNSSNLYGSSAFSGDPTNPLSGTRDPLVDGQDVSQFIFDVSTGLYYQVPGLYYLGLSVKNLLGSKIDQLGWQNARTLYLMGGYEYTFPFNPSLKLKPSALVKSADFSVFQAEAAVLVDYENAFWGGLGYRLGDAFTFLAGLNWKWFRLGVAYDLTTSKLGTFKSGRTFGTAEIFLSGSFRIEVPRRNPTVSRNTRYQL
ncbi:MAG: type IX secretion system membrane protein PorP/SprF [Bacteroidales bacterium]|nr:type IX secretion system membrane protein PorP/SprF [Bacteroidales bacterium]